MANSGRPITMLVNVHRAGVPAHDAIVGALLELDLFGLTRRLAAPLPASSP